MHKSVPEESAPSTPLEMVVSAMAIILPPAQHRTNSERFSLLVVLSTPLLSSSYSCSRWLKTPIQLMFASVTAVGATVGVPEVAVDFSGGGFSTYFSQPWYQASAVDPYIKQLGKTYKGPYHKLLSYRSPVSPPISNPSYDQVSIIPRDALSPMSPRKGLVSRSYTKEESSMCPARRPRRPRSPGCTL